MSLPPPVRSALAGSRLATVVGRSLDSSAVVDQCRRLLERARSLVDSLRTASREARLRGAVDAASTSASDWTAASAVAAAFDTGARWTRRSFLYGWLTAEPDPDVVVIDLRETITAAPFVEAVEAGVRGLPTSRLFGLGRRLAERFVAQPVRITSAAVLAALAAGTVLAAVLGALSPTALVGVALLLGAATLGLRVDASWEDLRESRAVQLLVAVLEPPAPPDEEAARRRRGTPDEATNEPEHSDRSSDEATDPDRDRPPEG